MKNPFKSSPRLVEKLATEKLLQWMTIIEIDRLLAAFKIEYYSRAYRDNDRAATCSSKVELVFLSQWAAASGVALSKAAGTPRYKPEIEECYERLKADIPDLFTGLNNGVAVGANSVVPRAWISQDGNAAPAYKFFTLNLPERADQYAREFAGGIAESLSFDEALSRVIGKAMYWIFDIREQPKLIAEFADPDAPHAGVADVYDVIGNGITRLVRAEIEKIIALIDG
jgi:hypothetical protein